MMVKYITDTGWYTEYACTDALAWTTYLWNSRSLIFSGNYIYTKHQELQEISTWFVLRDLMECGSIEEIITKIKKVKHASGFNLNIIDTKINRAYSIELYIDRVSVIEITDKLVHTNHFLHLENDTDFYPKHTNTKQRLMKTNELLNSYDMNKITIGDIKAILEYSNDDYTQTIHVNKGRGMHDESLTAALFLFDSKTDTIIIHDYLENAKMTFRLYNGTCEQAVPS